MRIQALSDLHLEFRPFDLPDAERDVLVLAGDIDVGVKGLKWAGDISDQHGLPVVYVAGNHEFYRRNIPAAFNKMADAARQYPNLHFLHDSEAVIHGVRFLGTTLWTDFRLFNSPRESQSHARHAMNDYRLIRVSNQGYRKFRPSDAAHLHATSLAWLQDRLKDSHEGATVVVSHHAPSLRSIAPHLQADALSPAFASSLDELVSGCGAALWIHGHTHHAADYMTGNTRVISNPRGYPEDGSVSGFRPELVVTV